MGGEPKNSVPEVELSDSLRAALASLPTWQVQWGDRMGPEVKRTCLRHQWEPGKVSEQWKGVPSWPLGDASGRGHKELSFGPCSPLQPCLPPWPVFNPLLSTSGHTNLVVSPPSSWPVLCARPSRGSAFHPSRAPSWCQCVILG